LQNDETRDLTPDRIENGNNVINSTPLRQQNLIFEQSIDSGDKSRDLKNLELSSVIGGEEKENNSEVA